ncbi:helix-turn-helix transcriptional regulator [Cytobacillus oceanisediminis]|uniref:helix-turn-helix transcriptional regulator n=1 Tax=Bacillaceae TaxID=186817 RepID=UPI001CCDD290|nr:AraC family transcriptional regulator [Cytobacillus oceanisediminis]MBZ9536395.1 helix-turn-helix transcriptional regulator [Cytobacillus oceanisediminis]
MFRKTIFKKIFLSFSVVIIIYTSIILFVTISQEYSQNRLELDKLNEMFLERESNIIDYRLDVSLNVVKLLSQQDVIVEFLEKNQFDYNTYSKLFNELTGNHFSNDQLGFNLAVLKDFGTDVTSSDGYFLFKDYMKFIHMDKNLEKLKGFMGSEGNNDLQCYDANDKLIIVHKIYYHQEKQNLYFFIVWEKKDLLMTNLPDENGIFGIVNESTLASTANRGENILSSFLPVENTHENQIVSRSLNDYDGYQKGSNAIPTINYLYITNVHKGIGLPIHTIKSIAIILFVLLLLGFILTTILSRKSYSPIEEIIKNIKSGEKKNNTEEYIKNELDYIISNIHDINKINKNLVQLQESSLSDLQENFLKNIIYENYDKQFIEKRLNLLQLDPFRDGGILAIVSMEGISEWESTLSEGNILTLRKKVLALFNDKDPNQKFISFPIDYQHFCLFFAEKNQHLILEMLNRMIHRIEQELGIEITFTLSQAFSSLIDLPEIFKSSFQLMEQKYSFIDTKCLCTSNVPLTSEKEYFYSVETESILINFMQKRDLKQAEKLIKEIVETNFREESMDIFSIYDFRNALINTLKRILNKFNLPFGDFLKENKALFFHLNSTDIEILKSTFIDIFNELMLLLGEKHSLKLSTVESVISYIQDNYTNDLSLGEVADHFQLSESYVSKLIKDHLKSSFKNYVNQLKVEKSKDLLKSGKYMVSEVGEMVGCKNVNTFIRIFKQYEGITPGKYVINKMAK